MRCLLSILARIFLDGVALCAVLFPVLALGGPDHRANLPELESSSQHALSSAQDKKLRRLFLREMRSQLNLVDDAEVVGYVQSLGQRIVASSDTSQQPYRFFTNHDPVINAFAGPGGIICINSGIILNSDNESELAAVVAHEIAHVTQGHLERSIASARQTQVPLILAMLGSLALGVLNPEAGVAAIYAATDLTKKYAISFTRENEAEADHIGMNFLYRAGFSPDGMPSFFGKLLRRERSRSELQEFLRTHPLTEQRIADSAARAAAYFSSTAIAYNYGSSKAYWIARTKLEVASWRSGEEAVRSFSARLNEAGRKEAPYLYFGYALSLMRSGDFARAETELKLLLASQPESPSFSLAFARVAERRGNNQEALARYETVYQHYPDNWPVVQAYVRALLGGQRPNEAQRVLVIYTRYSRVVSVEYYNLLAQVEAARDNRLGSVLARAEYLYQLGETEEAVAHLKGIVADRNIAPESQEPVERKISQLQDELTEEERVKL